MQTPMSLDRFRSIVAAYGADPERWPDAERDAAQALAGRSLDARRALDEARRLDRTLDRLVPPALSSDFAARLAVRLAAPVERPPLLLWVILGPAWRVAATALVAVLGVYVGLEVERRSTQIYDDQEIAGWMSGAPDTMDEFLEID